MNTYNELQVESAQCIWECVIENHNSARRIPGAKSLFADAFDDLGTVEIRWRLRQPDVLDACGEGWELLDEDTKERLAPYDWKYVPAFVLACLDDECLLRPDWKEALHAAIEAEKPSTACAPRA